MKSGFCWLLQGRRNMILFAHNYCFCLDFKADLKSSKLVADEDVVEKKLLLRLLDQAKFLREASEHCILRPLINYISKHIKKWKFMLNVFGFHLFY